MELEFQTKFTLLFSKYLAIVSLFEQKTQIDIFQLNHLEMQLTQFNPPFVLIKPSS